MLRRWARHWLRTCREVPSRASRLLDRTERSPEKRIHDFRRLMKAWRSLLKLAPAALAGEARALRGEIKLLRQNFGEARDATVVAKTLEEVLPGRVNAAEASPPAAPVPREELAAVRATLDQLSAEMERWSVASEGGGFLLAAFKRTYRKARRRARHDVTEMGLKRLHAWRTAVIDLGYQLSFFKPADPAKLEPQEGAAERLRSHLGTVVDLDMAREHLSDAVPAKRREGAEREIARSIVKRRRKAARIADSLLDERPKTMCAHLAEGLASRGPRRIRFV
ncbi:CHAD domain-containing protein [Bosea caraganae]|uniref:CHAD domain-containing protein n=2 Tax=Bosea caraganae TaxID=2763117 RepID=A0A370L3K6_9HYPH|nr:CHAD domain-containing protein [Bosea caraganae]RDJ28638.1 CHAD domain-containing protein [Bosea caraganae]